MSVQPLTITKRKEEESELPIIKKKATIDISLVEAFIKPKVKVAVNAKITKTRASFLWKSLGVEMYRVDVWVAEASPGEMMCFRREYITSSFFLQYDRKANLLKDITISK